MEAAVVLRTTWGKKESSDGKRPRPHQEEEEDRGVGGGGGRCCCKMHLSVRQKAPPKAAAASFALLVLPGQVGKGVDLVQEWTGASFTLSTLRPTFSLLLLSTSSSLSFAQAAAAAAAGHYVTARRILFSTPTTKQQRAAFSSSFLHRVGWRERVPFPVGGREGGRESHRFLSFARGQKEGEGEQEKGEGGTIDSPLPSLFHPLPSLSFSLSSIHLSSRTSSGTKRRITPRFAPPPLLLLLLFFLRRPLSFPFCFCRPPKGARDGRRDELFSPSFTAGPLLSFFRGAHRKARSRQPRAVTKNMSPLEDSLYNLIHTI